MAPAPRRSARARRPLPQSADDAMASASAPRRSARARRPPPRLADRAAASSSARARRRPARGPAAETGLPEEIWEDIFLRLDAAADLARASAACSTFRRIVSEPRFLRRFRSLRSPAVLGFISRDSRKIVPVAPPNCSAPVLMTYGDKGFLPVEPPHRSAPEARALERAADFTFSFIPDAIKWNLCHARGGRVLLSRRISREIWFDDFLVCDPLHRRYVRIPRIPDNLATAPRGVHLFPVLAPAGENDEDESFRIICTLQLKEKVMAFVFSSCKQTWTGITKTICLPNGYKFTEPTPYYAHGCLYWMFYRIAYSLMLDTSEMEFSIIDLPPHSFDSEHAIIEAEEGRLRFLTIADGTMDLYCKNWQRNGVGAQEWQHVKRIPLHKDSGINYTWSIVSTVGHCLALLGSREIYDELKKSEYFILDTKTSLLEKVCTLSNIVLLGIPYARFPPPFALPSI